MQNLAHEPNGTSGSLGYIVGGGLAAGFRVRLTVQADTIQQGSFVVCETPRYRSEIQEFAGFQNRDYFRKEILNPLIELGLLAPTLPDKPNSPNQQYRAVRR